MWEGDLRLVTEGDCLEVFWAVDEIYEFRVLIDFVKLRFTEKRRVNPSLEE